MNVDNNKIIQTMNVVDEIVNEALSAMRKFEPFNSAHEGFAVLHEEFDELWEEVKKNPKRRDPAAMRMEAIQVGAMALRFLLDCCPKEDDKT